LANAVQHAPGTVEVSFECPGDELVVVVRDHGNGLNHRSLRLPQDMMDEHGRGLFLIDALAERVTMQPWSGGTEMRMVLPL